MEHETRDDDHAEPGPSDDDRAEPGPPDGELGERDQPPLPTGTAGQAEEVPPAVGEDEADPREDEDVDRQAVDDESEGSFPASDPPGNY